MTKAEMVLELIRGTDVNGLIIIHNTDGGIWCMLKIIAKEHPEDEVDDGIEWNVDDSFD